MRTFKKKKIWSIILLTRIHQVDRIYRELDRNRVCKSLRNKKRIKKMSLSKRFITKTKIHILSNILRTIFTIYSLPSSHTHLVAFITTGVMAELVVPWPTERCTCCIIVIGRTLYSHPENTRNIIYKVNE